MATTKIEWTEKTWNPVRGCSLVSEGCRNCYAMRQARRFHGPGQPYEGLTHIVNGRPVWTGKVVCDESRLEDPLHWRKPCRIFVNSMSDLFHEDVPINFILSVFDIIERCPQHTFQVLTKRPERMKTILNGLIWYNAGEHNAAAFSPPNDYSALATAMGTGARKLQPLANFWLGVSVEDQETANERIPLLLQTPAAVRWVSYEPALAEVDFTGIPNPGFAEGQRWYHSLEGYAWESDGDTCPEGIHLDWIVAGAESGLRARPANIDWFRLVRDQCVAAGVPFFLKQFADHGRKIGTPELDGVRWMQYPEVRS